MNQQVQLTFKFTRICTLIAIAMGLMNCSSLNSSESSDSDPETVATPNSSPVSTTAPSDAPQLIARNSIPTLVQYQPSTADFPNPERGFHDEIELMRDRDFSSVRQKGFTLARTYVRLDEYQTKPLSDAFLNQLNQQFQLARSAGIKVILRFSYNFINVDTDKAPDAKLDITLKHINQLKPILQQNADVIAVMQAGFIGAWGEWHSSKNQLDRPQAKAKILTALLAALPPNRMVQVRYPRDLKANYPQPVGEKDAFRGKGRSRVGLHNDCFLANPTDVGTYDTNPQPLKDYLGKIAPFAVIGGETCGIKSTENRADCGTAEADLARFHWSYLNGNFHRPTLDRWKQAGCYSNISRKLGYRIQLMRSNFPSQIRSGKKLTGNFVVKNVGYASPFNPRGLELILRHQQTGEKYRLPILKPLSKTEDPRFWLPKSGEISVNISTGLGKNIPPGLYEILLNLPDPLPKLANRPEYSIRLANEQIWEPKTGFNSLNRTIEVIK